MMRLQTLVLAVCLVLPSVVFTNSAETDESCANKVCPLGQQCKTVKECVDDVCSSKAVCTTVSLSEMIRLSEKEAKASSANDVRAVDMMAATNKAIQNSIESMAASTNEIENTVKGMEASINDVKTEITQMEAARLKDKDDEMTELQKLMDDFKEEAAAAREKAKSKEASLKDISDRLVEIVAKNLVPGERASVGRTNDFELAIAKAKAASLSDVNMGVGNVEDSNFGFTIPENVDTGVAKIASPFDTNMGVGKVASLNDVSGGVEKVASLNDVNMGVGKVTSLNDVSMVAAKVASPNDVTGGVAKTAYPNDVTINDVSQENVISASPNDILPEDLTLVKSINGLNDNRGKEAPALGFKTIEVKTITAKTNDKGETIVTVEDRKMDKGKCPQLPIKPLLTNDLPLCLDACQHDIDCPTWTPACCRDATGCNACMAPDKPETEKPKGGYCPRMVVHGAKPLNSLDDFLCFDKCDLDTHCKGPKKCCKGWNGCNTCQDPSETPVVLQAKPTDAGNSVA